MRKLYGYFSATADPTQFSFCNRNNIKISYVGRHQIDCSSRSQSKITIHNEMNLQARARATT